MLRRTIIKLSLLACCTGALLTGCGGAGNDTAPVLKFSAIPDDNSSELKEKFDKLAIYLSEELGIEVQYVPSTSYSASVEAFNNSEIQFAWFGGYTGVQARELVPGSRAIVQGLEDTHYYSYFIAHKDTGLAAWNGEDGQPFPQDMAGNTFTFGSASSTSGCLMPAHYLHESTGQSASEFFEGEPGYSGSHDKTVEAVNSGSYRVGAVNYGTYDKMQQAGDADNCIIVWKTPEYPDYNMTVRADLDEIYGEGTTEKLTQILIAIADPELLAAFSRSQLIAAQNSDYQPIVDVAARLESE